MNNQKEREALARAVAEQVNATAQGNLGLMYANGQGVPQDDAQAILRLHNAGEQGDAHAQGNLANISSGAQLRRPSNAKAALLVRRCAIVHET